MYDHPVIKSLDQKLKTISDIPDDGKRYEAFANLRLQVSREKEALAERLMTQRLDDPGRLDPKAMDRYRELEISETYLSIADYANSTARHNMRNMIEGKTPTDQPTLGTMFRRAHDNAVAPKAEPRDKVTVTVAHNRQP